MRKAPFVAILALLALLVTASLAAAPPNSLRIVEEAVVDFVAPPPPPPPALVVDAAMSSVEASASSLEPGQSVDITVTLRTADGTVVPDKTVVLEASSGTASITPAEDVSDAAGQAQFVATDSAEGSVTFTAYVLEDDIVVPPPPAGEALPAGASWDAAYDAADCGDTFLVDGSYPEQSLNGFKDCAGNPVRFVEPAGARATLGGLSFQGASDVYVEGIEMTLKGSAPGAGNQHGVWVGPSAGNDGFADGSKRITLVDVDAGSVDSWVATGLTVRGGDYGPCDAVTGNNVCGNNKQDLSRDVLIEDAYFHDLEYDASAPEAHWECMYLNANTNLVLRNNRFERCAIFDVFLTNSGSGAAGLGHENITIEGNDFACATNGSGVKSRCWSSLSLSWCQNTTQPGYKDVLIRGNDFEGGAAGIEPDLNADAAGCSWENVRVEENVLSWPGRCQAGWLYARNTWVGGGSCD